MARLDLSPNHLPVADWFGALLGREPSSRSLTGPLRDQEDYPNFTTGQV